MKHLLRGLYAITPETRNTEQLLAHVDSALKGGINVLQYRAKILPATLRKQQANLLCALCEDYHCPFIINDDIDLAKKVGAHGVHLGQTDGKPAVARKQLGSDAIIGITCHDSLPLAEAAYTAGANYLAFGAFYPSTSKPLAELANASTLSRAKQAFPLPIVAIGGITPHNGKALVQAGADMLAVIDSLFTNPDIQAQCRQFEKIF